MAGKTEDIKEFPACRTSVISIYPAVFNPLRLLEYSGPGNLGYICFKDRIGIHVIIDNVRPSAAFSQKFKGTEIHKADNEHHRSKSPADSRGHPDGHDEPTQDEQG